MYTIPFLLWTSENGKRLIRVISHRMLIVNTAAELIHTVRFGGLILRRLRSNPFSGESAVQRNTRWIGNPYKKNALIDYDTLPYGDQVGNQ